jgi:hypothetical protein
VRSLPILKENAKLTAEGLFRAVFSPLYPAGADLTRLRATDANPGNNPSILSALDDTASVFATLGPKALDAPSLVLDRSDASVHRLAPLLTLDVRTRMLETQGEAPPLLAHFVIHGTIYVGACIVKNHGGAWLVRNPLWESRVRLESRAGTAEISPFAWWLKSLSDEEIGKATLLDRYRTHVEVPTFDPSTLDVIAPPDRRLPRLEKVSYDLFYKYLKAHLPELKDVGEDFPSPARFTELRFRWLEMRLVGDGRMLVIHGPTASGVAVLFLSKHGFLKQHYYETGREAAHRLEIAGDVLRLVISDAGREEIHETLYWGG